MTTNKDTYASTYSQAFIDSYPQLPAGQSKALIEKALKVALENIDIVLISGAAFKLTSKRLGIKHTKTAIKEYLNAQGANTMENCQELDTYIAGLPINYSTVFVPQSKSRNADEKSHSINWKITIKRNNNVLTTDYIQGIGFIPNYHTMVGWNNRRTIAVDEFEKLASEQGRYGRVLGTVLSEKLPPPLLRDVLYSLIMDSDVINHANFESWAGDLGYDLDSRKTEKIYDDCLSIALQLKVILGNEAMEKLRELFQDY